MGFVSAHTDRRDPLAAAEALRAQIGIESPAVILLFSSPDVDGVRTSGFLADLYPGAAVVGCTTAGEFTEAGSTEGQTTALALPRDKVERCAVAMARCAEDPIVGIASAADTLAQSLGQSLRTLDPRRYLGVALIDGLHMHEEQVSELLSNAAPFLDFVGGSAGDNLAFEETKVFLNGEATNDGAVLIVLELPDGFQVVKTCSFEPLGRTFEITRADAANRIVYEIDGRPAVESYAEATGVMVEALGEQVFMRHPLGVMQDDQPWIRSPREVVDGGGIRFYAAIEEGMSVELMRPTAMIAGTQDALTKGSVCMDGAAGALVFNCILRRLEMDATGQLGAFVECLAGRPTAGFHTYGETWLGHINQTLTAVLFK